MKHLGLILALCSASCVNQRVSPTDGLVVTMNLELLSPSPGTAEMPNTSRQATFNLTLFGDDGLLYPGDATVDVYISYSGVRTGIAAACGTRSDTPIETLTVRGGRLENHEVMLPVAYGATAIWVVERGSQVIGASVPIYFPNPTIPDIQTPPDPMAPNATFCTNFEKKFVMVDKPTGSGELLVDSVFGNAVTITDTGAKDFRSIYIFTFGRPDSTLVPGRHVNSFNGNISKFVGFTELNFPIVNPDLDRDPEPAKLPLPVKVTTGDLTNLPKLNALGASVVEVTASVCPTNPPNANNDPNIQNTIDQWLKYNTFGLSDTADCGGFTSYGIALPAKTVGTFDPTAIVGQKITVRGMLKNSSGQNAVTDAFGVPYSCDANMACPSGTCINGVCKKNAYNFWTVVVRGPDDLPQ